MRILLLVSLVLIGCSRWDREPKAAEPAAQAAPAPSPEAETARTMARLHAYAGKVSKEATPSFKDLESEYAWLSEKIEEKGVLDLSGSRNDTKPLTDLRPLAKLTGVNSLIARRNAVEFSALSDLALGVDLEALDLSETRADSIDFEALARFFPNLKSLTLDDCGFESDDAITLEGLTKLTNLSLRKNKLTRIPFSLPKSLIVLNLEKNQITGPFDQEILRFPVLRTLNLAHNRLRALWSSPEEVGPVFPESIRILSIIGNPEPGAKLVIDHCMEERSAGKLGMLMDFPLDEPLVEYAKQSAAEKFKKATEPKP